MSNRHYPPAYLRYLKARLWNLGRPSFWVTAILLSALGLVTWELLSDPDVFTQNQNQEATSHKVAESSLSTEDRAAIADIDNLPVLTQDLEQAHLAATLSIPEENSNAKNKQSLFDDVISQQPSATNIAKSNPSLGVNSTSTLKDNNPFVEKADNLLRSVYGDSPSLGTKSLTNSSEEIETATSPFNSVMGLTNQTKKAQNSVNISPSEATINQSYNQDFSNFNSQNYSTTNIRGTSSDTGVTSINQNSSNPTNIMGTASYNGATIPSTNSLPTQTLAPNTNLNTGTTYTQPTATNLTQNSYPNFNNSQPLPNEIPATTVTPPVTPAVSNNISPSSAPTSIPSVVNPPTPAVYGNYGVQQPTQLPQSRISLPRPTPGPYGGVQINGYTYP